MPHERNTSSDPLLGERWEEKAAHESGEAESPKGVELYFGILDKAGRDASLKPLADGLEKSIGDYADAVIGLSRARMSGGDRMAIQAADQHRHNAHEGLISSINAVSRWYAAHHIDNKWRRDIIGLSREAVGNWALLVARHVLGRHLEE